MYFGKRLEIRNVDSEHCRNMIYNPHELMVVTTVQVQFLGKSRAIESRS